jgi:hypothetical protein
MQPRTFAAAVVLRWEECIGLGWTGFKGREEIWRPFFARSCLRRPKG